MPLSRGTALTGFMALQSLLLCTGFQINAPLPKGVQLDWLAILNSDFEAFYKHVNSWLSTSIKVRNTSQVRSTFSDLFPTVEHVIQLLSRYSNLEKKTP